MDTIYKVCKNCNGTGKVKGYYYKGILYGNSFALQPGSTFDDYKETVWNCAACAGKGRTVWGYIERGES